MIQFYTVYYKGGDNSMDEMHAIQFHMDYQDVEFIISKTFDDEIKQHIFKNQNVTAPTILCYTPDEEARQLPFCIETAAHYTVGSRYYTQYASMENYQLIYTVQGQGIVECDDEKYICNRGSLLLLDCRIPHLYHTPKGEIWEFKHIHFFTNGGELVIQRCLGLSTIAGEVDRYFDVIFRELSNMTQNSIYLLSHQVSCILTDMIINKTKRVNNQIHHQLIVNAADYMRSHYSEKIKIEDLAKEEFISVYYFIRLFKEYYGVSPYEYLVKHRINIAKEQILQMVPFEEIAHNCGLGNLNNFFRIFKKHTNMTPNQYRSLYTSNDS